MLQHVTLGGILYFCDMLCDICGVKLVALSRSVPLALVRLLCGLCSTRCVANKKVRAMSCGAYRKYKHEQHKCSRARASCTSCICTFAVYSPRHTHSQKRNARHLHKYSDTCEQSNGELFYIHVVICVFLIEQLGRRRCWCKAAIELPRSSCRSVYVPRKLNQMPKNSISE